MAQAPTNAGQRPELAEPGVRDRTAEAGYHLLIVASQPLPGEDLKREVETHTGGGDPKVRIIFPAFTGSPLHHAMGDVDEAIAISSKRVDEQLRETSGLSWDVETSIGDSDPVIALQDGIRAFSPDEVLIVTRPDEQAGWLEDDFFERAQAGEHPPMTHVVVGEDKQVEEVEKVDAGPGNPKEIEAVPDSRNMPRYSTRDVAGIVVAIGGSIALIAIAAACPGRIAESGGTDTACTIELLIAGAISLINLAHVVGLVFFTATRYRGGWERFFSWFSLVGTPVAIAACLLISATHG